MDKTISHYELLGETGEGGMESIAVASSRMGFKDEVAYMDAPQPYG